VRSWAVAVAVLAATSVVAGCDGSTKDEASRDAQVYVATIRDVLAEQPPPPADSTVLPVVFVVGVGESKIPADVQAEVAVELDEDADIRFADKRSEALLQDQDHVPVRDKGTLVAVGEVAAEGDPVNVAVEVYRSDDDWSKLVLTIGRRSSHWTVTASTEVPADS
jgi:hypothetical protein